MEPARKNVTIRRRPIGRPGMRTRSSEESLIAAQRWNEDNAIKKMWADTKIASKTRTLSDEENELLNSLSGPPGEYIKISSETNENKPVKYQYYSVAQGKYLKPGNPGYPPKKTFFKEPELWSEDDIMLDFSDIEADLENQIRIKDSNALKNYDSPEHLRNTFFENLKTIKDKYVEIKEILTQQNGGTIPKALQNIGSALYSGANLDTAHFSLDGYGERIDYERDQERKRYVRDRELKRRELRTWNEQQIEFNEIMKQEENKRRGEARRAMFTDALNFIGKATVDALSGLFEIITRSLFVIIQIVSIPFIVLGPPIASLLSYLWASLWKLIIRTTFFITGPIHGIFILWRMLTTFGGIIPTAAFTGGTTLKVFKHHRHSGKKTKNSKFKPKKRRVSNKPQNRSKRKQKKRVQKKRVQ